MKSTLKTVLIAMVLTLITSGHAFASVLSEDFIKEEIKKDLEYQLKNKTKADVEIEVQRLPYNEIKVSEGRVIVETEGNFNYLSTKSVVKVNIFVNGYKERTFGVPVKIKISDYVWVAKEPIKKGKAFSFSNLKLVKKDISSNVKYAAREDFQCTKYLAGKNYRTGEVINKRFIESVPDVTKNSAVSVIFKTDILSLSIDAEAMENGRIGDYIKVKSRKYKRYYTGKVVSPNKVLVKI